MLNRREKVQPVTEKVVVPTEGGHGGPPLQYAPQSAKCLVVTGAVARTVGAALRGRPRFKFSVACVDRGGS